MDAHQTALIRASFAHVAQISGQAAAMFYARLFEIAPPLRALFKSDIEEQGRKLMAMIATVVANLDRLDTLVPAARALGARHIDYGVRDADYAPVAEALLWTLSEALGEAFTAETKAAWIEAYTVLAGQMQEAARTRQGEARRPSAMTL